MTKSSSSSSQRSHDPYTPLRAICCVSVMLAHTTSDLSVLFSGTMAVAFFLVLSGYLITKNVMSQIEPNFDEAPKFFGPRLLLKYLIRRFLRLYPMFILVAYIYSYEMFESCKWIDVLLLRESYGHLWTMRVEVLVSFWHVPIYFLCYSAFMIGMGKILPKPLFKAFKIIYHCIVCSIPFLLSHYRIAVSIARDPVDGFWRIKNIFFYGYVSGIISHYIQICKLTPKIDTPLKKGILSTLTYGSLIGIYLTNMGTQRNLFRSRTDIDWWQEFQPYFPVFALFVNCVEYAPETSHVMQFLNLKYLRPVGKASYSIYLIHKVPIVLIHRYTNIINTDVFTYDLIFTLILGAILYNLVEYPCIKLSHKVVGLMERCLDMAKDYIKRKTSSIQSKVEFAELEDINRDTP